MNTRSAGVVSKLILLMVCTFSLLARAETAPSFLDPVDESPFNFSQKGLKPRSMMFNRDGQFVGFIDAHGTIVDTAGNVRGQVHGDGAVTNAQGLLLGEVNTKGEIVDSEGVYLGVIQENGAAVSAMQNVVGEVIEIKKGMNGLPLLAPPSGSPPPGRANP